MIVEGKQVTAQQSVDNSYRRALAHLQDGRLDDAMALLQQTLQRDPRHQGARETLVRLLLEAQRPDEAMRQLQQSLALDPKQPAQAMTLARLQLDHSGGGAAALDTLKRACRLPANISTTAPCSLACCSANSATMKRRSNTAGPAVGSRQQRLVDRPGHRAAGQQPAGAGEGGVRACERLADAVAAIAGVCRAQAGTAGGWRKIARPWRSISISGME